MEAILFKNTNYLQIVGETLTLFLIFCWSFISSKKGFGFSLEWFNEISILICQNQVMQKKKKEKYDLLTFQHQEQEVININSSQKSVKPKAITNVPDYSVVLTCEIYIDSSCKLGLIFLFNWREYMPLSARIYIQENWLIDHAQPSKIVLFYVSQQ